MLELETERLRRGLDDRSPSIGLVVGVRIPTFLRLAKSKTVKGKNKTAYRVSKRKDSSDRLNVLTQI